MADKTAKKTEPKAEAKAKAEPAPATNHGLWVSKAELVDAMAHHEKGGKDGYAAAIGMLAASVEQPKMHTVDGTPKRVEPAASLSAKEGMQNLLDNWGPKEEGSRRLYVDKARVEAHAASEPSVAEALTSALAETQAREDAKRQRDSERLKASNEAKKANKVEKAGAER